MTIEGNDGDQEQRGKTEYDRTEEEDLCAVCSVCGDAFASGRARGISDDPVLGALYGACDTAPREGARYQGSKGQDHRLDGDCPCG